MLTPDVRCSACKAWPCQCARYARSLKPTVRITPIKPRCTDLAENPAATAELVLGGVEYLARVKEILQ